MNLCKCGCGKPVTKPRNRYLWGHNRRGKHFTVSLEARQKRSIAQKGRKHTAEAIQNICEAQLRRYARYSEAQKQKISEAHTGWKQTPETKQKLCEANLGRKHSLESRQKISEAVKLHWQNPKHKQRMSEVHKLLWQNPEYIKKVMKGQTIKPNKSELALKAILDKHFPEFQYNGSYNLGISLAGVIPDFVNVNGKKQVIELFGKVFHDPNQSKRKIRWKRTELGSIMAYNALGYKCLIIWDYELKNEEAIIKKVGKWVG